MCTDIKMSKPNDGFDLDNYDCADYASALEGENPSSTENVWTPVRRHKKRKASGSPLNQISYIEAVQSTIKKMPQTPKTMKCKQGKQIYMYCFL